ncbi:expressed unknown protein [Seminavis robusta]|uniref:Uncharacterized protein n=1 Tax=Seminavis robusta TaxID=568900 RepID=A0A9N8H5U4_9STRA|nr:expressed unknown protein [Seminavis robusta]|eukprot:Sro124_g059940.1 n/a (277) ;mRNA; f:70440-71270
MVTTKRTSNKRSAAEAVASSGGYNSYSCYGTAAASVGPKPKKPRKNSTGRRQPVALPPLPPPPPLITIAGGADYHRNHHKVYVLIGTHHVKDDVDPYRGRLQCTSKTTVCGVFTTRALAIRAMHHQIHRMGLQQHDPDDYVCHLKDGSYCTTFQIAEREIWGVPHAERNVFLDPVAERAQWTTDAGAWMKGDNPMDDDDGKNETQEEEDKSKDKNDNHTEDKEEEMADHRDDHEDPKDDAATDEEEEESEDSKVAACDEGSEEKKENMSVVFRIGD